MVTKKYLRTGRIIFSLILITILMIIIVPKPNKTTKTSSKGALSPTEKSVVHTINLTKNGFEPKDIEVKKGDLIMWVNKSEVEASVNSDDYPNNRKFPVLNLGTFESNSTLQTRIFKIGKLSYHNQFKPTQTGTITVK